MGIVIVPVNHHGRERDVKPVREVVQSAPTVATWIPKPVSVYVRPVVKMVVHKMKTAGVRAHRHGSGRNARAAACRKAIVPTEVRSTKVNVNAIVTKLVKMAAR